LPRAFTKATSALTPGRSHGHRELATALSVPTRQARQEPLSLRGPDQAEGARRMNIRHTPNTVAAPFGPYSHAVEVPEGSRLLYISGEVGVLPDGTVPQGIE